ncbi:MAG: hypothetical protein ACFE8Z_09485 [Candidatus Hermodarchaeota archaeon]
MDQVMIGFILLILSVIPLGFLIYTLLNLETLEISITHPRVIVELSIFAILLITGLWLVLS